VFTDETAIAKAKSSENFLSDQILVVFGGLGLGGTKSIDFYSKRHTSLPESASFKPFCVTIG